MLPWLLLLTLANVEGQLQPENGNRPNILFLLADDLGYGDVDICPELMDHKLCPLRPTDDARKFALRTPRLKQMAAEGMIFTNAYAPRPICSPSRMASLSGRDPVRYVAVDQHLRIFANSGSRGGFPATERSTADRLKALGYSTGYAGKWHMGLTNGRDEFAYAPWKKGFDSVEFFLEGSNGEPCAAGALNPEGNEEVMHMCSFSHIINSRGDILEQPIRWENITSRQLRVTIDFIRKHENGSKPWFFQHAFTGVHVPWNPSRYFVSDPVQKLWTDMVSELDWAVGVLLDELRATGQENTVVMFSSDNGPYLEFASSFCPSNCRIQMPAWQAAQKPKQFGCTPCNPATVSLPGPLSGGKGQIWEGGVRVPTIWWWPGRINAGTVNPMVSSQMDFLPTVVALAGGQTDVETLGILDGQDISKSLVDYVPNPSALPEGEFYYWCGTTLMAVRFGSLKVYWQTQKWVGKEGKPTSPLACGGTGKCCEGSPSRLCTCGGQLWEQYVDIHDPPRVVDLSTNLAEDFAAALSGDAAAQAIATATKLRLAKLRSVASDLQLEVEGKDMETIGKEIRSLPNLMQVDVQINGLPALELQMKEFRPYDHCFSGKPDDKCRSRFPCAQQSGYEGPFEYEIPDGKGGTKKCGAFRQPSGTSFFPEDLLSTVAAWHDAAGLEATCPAGNETAENAAACKAVADYGLNNIPTGHIWNEPYSRVEPHLVLEV